MLEEWAANLTPAERAEANAKLLQWDRDGYWHPLHASSGATCLLAMAVGCFANSIKNRTYHCILTGPLFLIAAILLMSSEIIHVTPRLIWTGVVVGTGIAFSLEWRYARKQSAAI